MNPLKPFKVFSKAITLPFTALFVIGITYQINMMTAPHHLWYPWVVLGMGIAVVVAWARALKTLALMLGVAGVAGLAWMAFSKWKKTPPARPHGGLSS